MIVFFVLKPVHNNRVSVLYVIVYILYFYFIFSKIRSTLLSIGCVNSIIAVTYKFRFYGVIHIRFLMFFQQLLSVYLNQLIGTRYMPYNYFNLKKMHLLIQNNNYYLPRVIGK